jgi:hypothetical protein
MLDSNSEGGKMARHRLRWLEDVDYDLRELKVKK